MHRVTNGHAGPIALSRCGAIRLDCRPHLRTSTVQQDALIGVRQVKRAADLFTGIPLNVPQHHDLLLRLRQHWHRCAQRSFSSQLDRWRSRDLGYGQPIACWSDGGLAPAAALATHARRKGAAVAREHRPPRLHGPIPGSTWSAVQRRQRHPRHTIREIGLPPRRRSWTAASSCNATHRSTCQRDADASRSLRSSKAPRGGELAAPSGAANASLRARLFGDRARLNSRRLWRRQ